MEDKKLFNTVKKLFSTLYSRGILDFEAYLGHNNKYFSTRENRRATLITFVVGADLDKVNPMSENYDPKYVEVLDNTQDIGEIKKYLGEPNLVIIAEYEWDDEDVRKIGIMFQNITHDIVGKLIDNPYIREGLNYIPGFNELEREEQYNKFYEEFDFGVYPMTYDSNPKLTLSIESNKELLRYRLSIISSIVFEELQKHGFRKDYIFNNLGSVM